MTRTIAVAATLVATVLAPAAQARKFFGGVVPDGTAAAGAIGFPNARAADLPYEGGPVLHANRTHLIFWQPQGSGLSFDPGYESLIETFLGDVSADSHRPTNVYGLTGQYTDTHGPAVYDSSYGGAIVADDPLPANGCIEPIGPPAGDGPGWHDCLDDEQMQAEITHVVDSNRLPETTRDVYLLVLPYGFGNCEFSGPTDCALGGTASGGYCGYHSATPAGLPYAVIPYNALPGHCQSDKPRPNSSPADPAISTVSHEHNEMITDPLGNGWIDTSFDEDGDLCLTSFGPALGGSGPTAYNEVLAGHHYYLQEEWSNEDGSCQARDESDPVWFRSTVVRSKGGTRTGFAAHAIDPDGSIAAYDWSFGDHRAGRGRRTWHVFRRGGAFRVVLRVTDRAGNWAFYGRTLRITTAPGAANGR